MSPDTRSPDPLRERITVSLRLAFPGVPRASVEGIADVVLPEVAAAIAAAVEVERSEWNPKVGRVIARCQDNGWPRRTTTVTVHDVMQALHGNSPPAAPADTGSEPAAFPRRCPTYDPATDECSCWAPSACVSCGDALTDRYRASGVCRNCTGTDDDPRFAAADGPSGEAPPAVVWAQARRYCASCSAETERPLFHCLNDDEDDAAAGDRSTPPPAASWEVPHAYQYRADLTQARCGYRVRPGVAICHLTADAAVHQVPADTPAADSLRERIALALADFPDGLRWLRDGEIHAITNIVMAEIAAGRACTPDPEPAAGYSLTIRSFGNRFKGDCSCGWTGIDTDPANISSNWVAHIEDYRSHRAAEPATPEPDTAPAADWIRERISHVLDEHYIVGDSAGPLLDDLVAASGGGMNVDTTAAALDTQSVRWEWAHYADEIGIDRLCDALDAARAEVAGVTAYVSDAYRTCNENRHRALRAEAQVAALAADRYNELARLREWQQSVADALGISEPAGEGHPWHCEEDPSAAARYASDASRDAHELIEITAELAKSQNREATLRQQLDTQKRLRAEEGAWKHRALNAELSAGTARTELAAAKAILTAVTAVLDADVPVPVTPLGPWTGYLADIFDHGVEDAKAMIRAALRGTGDAPAPTIPAGAGLADGQPATNPLPGTHDPGSGPNDADVIASDLIGLLRGHGYRIVPAKEARDG
jgi:hypothetical protein